MRLLLERLVRDNYLGRPARIVDAEYIRVLVRSSLPRALWIAEIDLDIGGYGESFVIGQLHATVPSE